MRRLPLLLAAALLAACGGGAKGLSHEQFVARADSICSDYYRQLARVPPPVFTTPAVRRWFEGNLRLYERLKTRLGALAAPGDDRQQLDEILRLTDLLLEQSRENIVSSGFVQALETIDPAELKGLSEAQLLARLAQINAALAEAGRRAEASTRRAQPITGRVRRLARQLGLGVCFQQQGNLSA